MSSSKHGQSSQTTIHNTIQAVNQSLNQSINQSIKVVQTAVIAIRLSRQLLMVWFGCGAVVGHVTIFECAECLLW